VVFSKKIVKDLFKKYKIRPLKYLGQNFLIDNFVLKKIIKAAELSKNDIVLEIGPGVGNLTIELAKGAKKVIAIEKDKRMVEILKEVLKDFKNVKIIQGDILKTYNLQLTTYNYKVVANLPYYLTSPVIRKFLESKTQPKEMILMVQKEVAQRICPPSLKLRRASTKPKMNLLAISVLFYAKPEIISFVSKNSFWPKPKVNSAIIKIIPYKPRTFFSKKVRGKSVLIRINPRLFFKVVKAGFSHPRKKVLRNLEKELKLDKEKVEKIFLENKIDFNSRAENLSLKDWLLLVQDLCYNNLGKYENQKIF